MNNNVRVYDTARVEGKVRVINCGGNRPAVVPSKWDKVKGFVRKHDFWIALFGCMGVGIAALTVYASSL